MNISINTAQNVHIEYTPAQLLERILATIVDYVIIIAIGIPLFYLFDKLGGLTSTSWYPYLVYLPLLGYHLICESLFHGQTAGKSLLHLQVVRLDGQRLTFWECLLRWVFRLFDIGISGGAIAILTICFSRHAQRLGDMLAGTVVIRQSRPRTFNSLPQENIPDDYQLTFPNVTLLSDKDIRVIQEVLNEVRKRDEYQLLDPLAAKIKSIINTESDLSNLQFVETVLKDYFYLTR